MTTLLEAWEQFKTERAIALCPTSLVANWAGNSSEVIWKHYVNVTQEYEMPVL
jgi:hypothetical protein